MKNSMEKLVILDYSDLSVHFYDVDTEEDVDIEKLGFKESECSWMYGEDINLKFHKETIR